MKEQTFKFDKNSFSVITLKDDATDVDYWRLKTPEDRLLAVEFLRQLIFNYDPATERLQRFFESVEFKTN